MKMPGIWDERSDLVPGIQKIPVHYLSAKVRISAPFQSDVPEKANAMAPQIGQFVLMRQQFENMENMARMLEKQGGDQKQDRYDSSNRPERPYFDVPAPFESFFVDLKLNHPYWRSFRGEITAPSFDRDYPSLDSYLKSYQKKADNLHAFARDFIHMMNPGAQEIYDGVETARPQAVPQVTPQSVPQAAPAQASDPIQEIQKYKSAVWRRGDHGGGVYGEEEAADGNLSFFVGQNVEVWTVPLMALPDPWILFCGCSQEQKKKRLWKGRQIFVWRPF